MNLIPDKVNNFNVYLGTAAAKDKLVGVTDEVTLPKVQYKSETINFAGMAGEIDSPAEGQVQSIEMEIPFVNVSSKTLQVAAESNEPIIIRGAQEFIDPEAGTKCYKNRTITVKGMTKAINFGSMIKGGHGKPTVTKEVVYYKEEIDGEVVAEIDKYHGKNIVGGIETTKGIQDCM